MKTYDTTWIEANQQYLSGMVKLMRERIAQQSSANSISAHDAVDFSGSEHVLKALAESMPEPPAIEKLATILGLTSFEKDLLLMCAAFELDTGWEKFLSSGTKVEEVFQPCFGLGLNKLPGAHWSAVSTASPLRHWNLIETAGMQSVTRGNIRIEEHILHYITGISGLHETLSQITAPFLNHPELVPSQVKIARNILKTIMADYTPGLIPVIELSGMERLDKLEIAAYTVSMLGSSLYSMSAYAIPVNSKELTELARLWSREAALNNYALFFDTSNIDVNDKQRLQAVIRFIENIHGVVFLNADTWTPELQRNKIAFDTAKPTTGEQLELWETLLGKNEDQPCGYLEKIVSQFDLGSGVIRKVAAEVAALPADEKESPTVVNEENIWKACCRYTRPQVDELAQRIEPVATWDDIVLPEFQKTILKEIASQVKLRNKVYDQWGFGKKSKRGLGISALFAGESGTGKTMASEVLANELNLDLYKIDLSKVVNKYIGETEKNLKRIFDAAEGGGAILLFDEADALFGKRSDVKDSHDRYSNIEVSYLLQRMEAYRGLAILTTNMKSAVDKAFVRRIRFILQFQFPDTQQRAEIWGRAFPQNTPREHLDVEKLSRLSIAGGSIRNIAMNAAFIAADEDRPVNMMHIFRAARSEYDKTEKALNSAEFKGWT